MVMQQKMIFREKQTHPVLSHQLKLMSHGGLAKIQQYNENKAKCFKVQVVRPTKKCFPT